MKKTSLILIFACSFSTAVCAKGSPWYMGLIGGFMDADNGITDNAINIGLNLGYQNNRFFSTEIEFTTTAIDGETRNGNDWNVDTLSLYGALRTATKDVKFKGKLGITDIDTGNNDDTGLSIGFGISFNAFGGLTEIEYTDLGGDNDLSFLSLGVKYYF